MDASVKKRRGRPPRRPIPVLASRKIRLPRVGLHRQATDALRHLIVTGKLAPGSPLAEAELSEALGVSRTPLREALKLLAAEGLVELRPNRTTRVSTMNPQDMTELFEAVSGIERVAAELAAQRITPAELRQLRTLQADMEQRFKDGDRDEYFAINQEIHRVIVAASKSRPLVETHALLLARAERARYFALGFRHRWDESIAEHHAILDALTKQDSKGAGEALGAHVARTGFVVAKALSGKARRRSDTA
jgi:DNA-binding GntR family transcriptional regulator